MHPIPRLAPALLAALLLAPLPVAAAVPPATSAPALPHAFDALIQKLGDPSFTIRQQAQADLDQIPLSQRDALAQVADQSSDAEIKARLLEHVGIMDERLATDPPPISVDFNDASATVITAALNRATGAAFTAPPAVSARYTLAAVNQPFWEIMRQLSDQHPLWPAPPDGTALSERPYAHALIFRGFAFLADDPRFVTPTRISLTLSVALDPRIAVLDLQPMTVDDARDDQHHILHLDPDPNPAAARLALARRPASAPAPHFQSRTVTFTASEPPAKTLTVKGAVNLLVEVAHTSFDIPNATQHLNEPLAAGDSTFILRNVLHSAPVPGNGAITIGPPAGAAPNVVGIALQIVPKDSPNPAPDMPNIQITATGAISIGGGKFGGGGNTLIDYEGQSGGIFSGAAAPAPEKTRIRITDATGKIIANYSLPRGAPVTSIHLLPNDFKEPLSFSLTIPTRTRQATIPFEFQNLPLHP